MTTTVIGTHSGFLYYLPDPLWDGGGCSTGNGCCVPLGMSWFYRKLPMSYSEDFEVRICKDSNRNNEDIAIEKLELYLQ